MLSLLISPAFLLGQTPLLAIHEIQGSGNSSPFVGQTVQVDTAIVLFANPGVAYLQSLHPDDDPLTSEGLMLTGGDLLSLVPGDLVIASGQVRETEGMTNLGGSVNIQKLGSHPLPSPVDLQVSTFRSAVPDYERYEGMLVNFKITIAQGASPSGTTYAYPTPNRPFREPGLLPPGLAGLPMFDDNPELLRYASSDFGQPNFLFLNAGDRIDGVGILQQNSSGYRLSPTQAVSPTIAPIVQAVRPRQADEITVSSFNVLRLSREEGNYATQLTKVVNYIGQVLQYPDVLGIQELGGQAELEDLIFRLRQTDPLRGDYYGFVGSGVFNIRSAMLVHKRLPGAVFEQLDTNELLSTGGILHDRAPLLATLPLPTTPPTQLQVLNLHLRSLNGIDDQDFVRIKRYEQSQSVAHIVQQKRNAPLLIVGDLNAFEFTDGYVDVVSQIAGRPSLGALYPPVDIVDPPLEILSNTLPPPEQRYSYVFRGSAQTLDHCLANDLQNLQVLDLQYGRGNADATTNLGGNTTTTARSSDHDGFVLYLRPDETSASSNLLPSAFQTHFPNPARAGDQVRLEGTERSASIQIVNALGQRVWQGQERNSFQLPRLAAGMYWMQIVVGQERKLIPFFLSL